MKTKFHHKWLIREKIGVRFSDVVQRCSWKVRTKYRLYRIEDKQWTLGSLKFGQTSLVSFSNHREKLDGNGNCKWDCRMKSIKGSSSVMQATHIYNPYSVSKEQSYRLTSFVRRFGFKDKVNKFVKFKIQNKMETIKLHKYTLKYYLGVYLSTDDERYFRCVCHQKKGRRGWSCEINGKSMEINEYLNNK